MNYLSDRCLEAYWKQYPKGTCSRGEPGEAVFVSAKGKTYIQPDDETEDSFLDRLKRSKDQGENLFFSEWPQVPEDDEDDLCY